MAAGWRCGQTGFRSERLEPDAAWIAWNVPENGIRLLHLHSRRVSQRLHVAARHEYILPAIVVEIGDGWRISRHRHAEPGHAAAPGDIAETMLPEIPEDWKSFIVERHESDVRQAVVVEIPKVHPHSRNEPPVLLQRHPGIERGLLKLTFSQVVKQRILNFIVE